MASAAVGYARSLGADGPPRGLRRPRARRLLLPDRHQHRRLPPHRLEAHPEAEARRRPTTSSSSSPIRAGRRRPTSPICTCRCRPGLGHRAAQRACCTCSAGGAARSGASSPSTRAAGTALQRGHRRAIRPSARRRITGLSAEIIVDGGAPLRRARGRRSRCGAWGSTRATSAPTRTRRSSTCTWPRARSAGPGAGPFSLTGQPNAMGGRETGGLAHLLPGYRLVADAAARAAVERALGRAAGHDRAARRAARRSRSSRGCATGEVRAVWILCTNPAASMPDLDLVEKALRQAELVIVQDAYHPTETTRFADVLLPAAQWPEKDGVMTNSERRLTLPAEARGAAGRGAARRRRSSRASRARWAGRSAFAYASARRDLRRVRGADRGHGRATTPGVSHARLQARGAAPVAGARARITRARERLYTDGRFPTADGRARFVAVEHDRARRAARRDYPADPHHRAACAITGTRSPARASRRP